MNGEKKIEIKTISIKLIFILSLIVISLLLLSGCSFEQILQATDGKPLKNNQSAEPQESNHHKNSKPRSKHKSSSNNINQKLSDNFDQYVEEIYEYTGYKLENQQISLLKDYIANNDIYFLPQEERAEHRKDFDTKRKMLIAKWQENTDKKWPKYSENFMDSGKIVRYAGQNYDAHHIIEVAYNGPNAWWNLTPARFLDQHQEGIHRKGSLANKIFSFDN